MSDWDLVIVLLSGITLSLAALAVVEGTVLLGAVCAVVAVACLLTVKTE